MWFKLNRSKVFIHFVLIFIMVLATVVVPNGCYAEENSLVENVGVGIKSVTPPDKSIEVPRETTYTVEFETEMDASTIIAGNIKVNGMIGYIKEITVPETRKSCVISFNTLDIGETYTMTFKGLKDLAGQTLSDYQYTFTVGEVNSPNIVQGGDFEDESVTYGTENATYQRISDPVFTLNGNYSLNIKSSSAYGGITFPYSGNAKTFAFSYWCRLDPNNNTNKRVKLYLINNGDTKNMVPFATNMLNTVDYIKLAGTYTYVGNVENAFFKMNADNPADRDPNNAGVYIDDLYIKPLDPLARVPSNDIIDAETDKLTLKFNTYMNTDRFVKEFIKINGSSDLIDRIDITPGKYKECTIYFKGLELNKEYNITLENFSDIYGRNLGEGDSGVNQKSFKYITKPKFRVGNINMYNATQENITKLEAGSLRVNVSSLRNFTTQETSFTLVVVLFKDGQLHKINSKKVDISADNEYAALFDVPIDAMNVNLDDGVYELKVYPINNFNDLQLLADVKTFTE